MGNELGFIRVNFNPDGSIRSFTLLDPENKAIEGGDFSPAQAVKVFGQKGYVRFRQNLEQNPNNQFKPANTGG